MIPLYAGGPCSCKDGRYVRFVIPHGVPGCEAVVSCRGDNSARGDITEHTLPTGGRVFVRVPPINGHEVFS